MIIPWRVDVPQQRWPFVNWLIIAAIIAVFVLQVIALMEQARRLQTEHRQVTSQQDRDQQPATGQAAPAPMARFVLNGWTIRGLFGYMWLHGGIIHLVGNLLFLWIFGNAVCAKIGNLAYLPIYIFLGVFAGVAHLLFHTGAGVGASGAIMGVVGMYLVFFPENDITCYFIWVLFFHPVIREFTISSYWMVLFWLAFDILGAAISGGGRVAYFAHLGGFAAGFSLAILMLKMNWVQMYKYETSLLQMLWRRKQPLPKLFGANPAMFLYDTRDGISEPLAGIQEKTIDPEKIPLPAEPQSDEFVRFTCTCGKKLKVPVKYAGKTGKCPRCKNPVTVPWQ